MQFYVMTLFPEMIAQGLGHSMTARAAEKGLIRVEAVNIRDYTDNKNGRTDDYPYGGGAGMVMQCQPVWDCYQAILKRLEEEKPGRKRPRTLYMTPQGRPFDQKLAEELSREEELIFLCGHYEGVDERVLELMECEGVSIGDYVLTGGELPAMVMIDCISRLIPGVLGKDESALIESFHDGLLEYPQYSRPEEFMGRKVPEILLSGHHAKVEEWRRRQSIERTLKARPDLLEHAVLSRKEQKYLEELLEARRASSEHETRVQEEA